GFDEILPRQSVNLGQADIEMPDQGVRWPRTASSALVDRVERFPHLDWIGPTVERLVQCEQPFKGAGKWSDRRFLDGTDAEQKGMAELGNVVGVRKLRVVPERLRHGVVDVCRCQVAIDVEVVGVAAALVFLEDC